MYLIRAGSIDNIDWLLKSHGVNPLLVLSQVGLPEVVLRDPETLVSYAKVADLMEYGAKECRDELFGFHLAQMQSPLALGEFASLINQQHTFGEALQFSQNYLHIHARGLRLKQVNESERIEIHSEFDFYHPTGLTQLMQLSIGQQVEYLKVLMPHHFSQLRIHFKQANNNQPNNDLGEYQQIISRNNQFNGVSFPASWLNKEISKSAEVASAYSQQRIKALNARFPNDLLAQVTYLCGNLMSTGECTIEKVAESLSMHPRTLQRKIKSQGTHFRELLISVRQQRAKQYLMDSRMSITDIALNLGYAETAVFSRNFKQWTGESPLQWRGKYSNV